MTSISSNEVSVPKPMTIVSTFFNDISNLRLIMPEQVVEWIADGDSCSFTLQGMGRVAMTKKKGIETNSVTYLRSGKAPFEFSLSVYFHSADENNTICRMEFDAELNLVMQMMAERPLRNFLNMLTENFHRISHQ